MFNEQILTESKPIHCPKCDRDLQAHFFLPSMGRELLTICKDCRLPVYNGNKQKKIENIPSDMRQCSNCKKIKPNDQFQSKTGQRLLKTCRPCIQAVSKINKWVIRSFTPFTFIQISLSSCIFPKAFSSLLHTLFEDFPFDAIPLEPLHFQVVLGTLSKETSFAPSWVYYRYLLRLLLQPSTVSIVF